jgi:hypothetical protein
MKKEKMNMVCMERIIRCVLPKAARGWYSGSLGSGGYPDCAKKMWA